MIIDRVFPAVIADRSTLRQRLLADAAASGLSDEIAVALISEVPDSLIGSGAFLDGMTGLWRYEFGLPFEIGGDLVWGTHMWVQVAHLFAALSCAYFRLPQDKRAGFLARLAEPERHRAVLVEMIPAHKVDLALQVEHEVAGLGDGNRTVDWLVRGQDGRIVLLDVKSRSIDLIRQAEGRHGGSFSQPPDHDPALLLRSIQQKFKPANPDTQLQGAWICTHVKQDEEQLTRAFSALCSDRVHFVIFGDWAPDAYVLARTPADQRYLFDLFRVLPSTRLTFRVGGCG